MRADDPRTFDRKAGDKSPSFLANDIRLTERALGLAGSGHRMPEPGLRFQLLGPIRVWRGDDELELGSPQQQAVLALLTVSRGRQVSVDETVDAVWGERPPRTAVHAVRTYVSRLRSCLGRSMGSRAEWSIRSTGRGYVLTLDSPEIDLSRFESLIQEAGQAGHGGETARAARLLSDALALWRGTPLAGVPGPHAANQRIRLEELRATATEQRIAADIESGRLLSAVPDLRVLLAYGPLRERVAELLMLALYRSGRQTEALSVFAAIRDRLREDLGIDPGPSLQTMHQMILRADDKLMGGAGMLGGPLAPSWRWSSDRGVHACSHRYPV
jgi:DNA-binding SARP family transcriptional activator